MGKDLKGKELGKGISQRKDGRYQARFTDRFGKRRCVYGITLKEVKNALMSEVVDNYSKNNAEIIEPFELAGYLDGIATAAAIYCKKEYPDEVIFKDGKLKEVTVYGMSCYLSKESK